MEFEEDGRTGSDLVLDLGGLEAGGRSWAEDEICRNEQEGEGDEFVGLGGVDVFTDEGITRPQPDEEDEDQEGVVINKFGHGVDRL